jgi:hypothetical protein
MTRHALLLILIAPVAIARADSDRACASAGQEPQVINARIEVQRRPDVLVTRLHLADLLVNASCFYEAIHVLEAGEAANPRNSLLQYRLTRARSMAKEKEYFEGIGKAEVATRQLAAAEPQMRQNPAPVVAPPAATDKVAEKVVEKTADKLSEAAPRRTSFSNVEPASRSN